MKQKIKSRCGVLDEKFREGWKDYWIKNHLKYKN